MKKTLLIITSLVFITSLSFPQSKMDIDGLLEVNGKMLDPNSDKPYSGSVFELYDNGQKKLNGRYRNGLKNGKWKWWSEAGKMDSSGTFKNGIRNGKWILWHENGQKKSERNYKNGELYGKWTEWHENGQKKIEKTIKDRRGEPKIDFTNDETMNASVEKVRRSLSQDKVDSFDEALMILAYSQISFENLYAEQASGVDFTKSKMRNSLHGKTGLQIIEEAERIKNDREDRIKNDREEKSPLDRIKEFRNWYTSEIWNDGIVQFTWYLSSGRSSTGGDIDIEFALRNYNKAIVKLDEYNKYIEGLNDKKYEDLKYSWNKAYGELLIINDWLKNNEMKANYKGERFSTGRLGQYMDSFDDAYDELKELQKNQQKE
jgi:hypothetical protein